MNNINESDKKVSDKKPIWNYTLLLIASCILYSMVLLISYAIERVFDRGIFGPAFGVFGGLITLIVYFEYTLIRRNKMETSN